MKTYIIKDTFNGLLSAIFYYYANKDNNVLVFSNYNKTSFIDEIIEIEENPNNALRVNTKLKKILKLGSYNKIFIALKSGNENKYTIVFNYLVESINHSQDISTFLSNKSVYAFYEITSQVLLEAHRYKGFIRFNKTSDGIYYACFSPDNDICELIFPHFIRRFTSMPFILHDTTFNRLCAYNGKEKRVATKKLQPLKINDEISKLFKTYYDSVNIESRKNTKLMLNYMPKRYHKNMPEKNELL